jgi:hypothetical protein
MKEKIEQLQTRIDSTKNNLLGQMEELKDLEDLKDFQIPDDFAIEEKKGGGESIKAVHKFVSKISSANNQLNLINSMIEGINSFCTRAALFLIRDDKLVGWNGKGFSKRGGEVSDKEIKNLFFSLSANTIFKYVLEKKETYSGEPATQPDDHLIYSRFGGDVPDKIFVLPFFVKGKPQAVIYTDSFDKKEIEQKEIEIISTVGEMSLDLLPLRQKMMARVKTKEFVEEEPEAKPEPEEEAKGETVSELEMDKEETMSSVKESDPERLARVIVNDIILYNKKAVEEGRKNKNLFEIMENTIMQSKELYLNKYDDLQPFESQLLDNLAQGDREALQGYNFESI